MPRLLIAGFGFLGKSLKFRFLDEGWDVDALSLHAGRGCNGDGTEVISCDLSSAASVNALSGDYDLIIHCAATRGGGVEAYRAVYLDGVRHLRARFPDTPIIFTSSTSVYGQTDHLPVTEESLAEAMQETAVVLREAEQCVLASGGAVLRLSALCGPGRCHTIQSFLKGAARISREDGGRRILNFVHRDDVADACFLLTENWGAARGQIFNVSAIALSQHACFSVLADHFDRLMPPVAEFSIKPSKRGRTSKVVVSDRIKELGWNPRFADLIQLYS